MKLFGHQLVLLILLDLSQRWSLVFKRLMFATTMNTEEIITPHVVSLVLSFLCQEELNLISVVIFFVQGLIGYRVYQFCS
jgi:hypothetical protein